MKFIYNGKRKGDFYGLKVFPEEEITIKDKELIEKAGKSVSFEKVKTKKTKKEVKVKAND